MMRETREEQRGTTRVVVYVADDGEDWERRVQVFKGAIDPETQKYAPAVLIWHSTGWAVSQSEGTLMVAALSRALEIARELDAEFTLLDCQNEKRSDRS